MEPEITETIFYLLRQDVLGGFYLIAFRYGARLTGGSALQVTTGCSKVSTTIQTDRLRRYELAVPAHPIGIDQGVTFAAHDLLSRIIAAQSTCSVVLILWQSGN